MYLCCRVKRKKGAGLLYSNIGLCIHIGKIRYVRLLFPYPSATHIVHIDIVLVPFRNVQRYCHIVLLTEPIVIHMSHVH